MKNIYFKSVDGKKSGFSYFVEILGSKNIIYEFFKRDLKTLYAQSIFGPIFYLILPLLQTTVFNFFINKFFSNQVDYSTSFLVIFVNMIFWNLFSSNTTKGSAILISSIKLINKVYIPRLVYFISPYFVSLVHFSVQFIFFIILFFFIKINNNLLSFEIFSLAKLILIIPILIYCFFLYFSIAVIISMLSVKYRDIIHLVGYGFQLALFVSPVLYSLSDLSGLSYFLIALNPYSFIPEVTRWIFFDNIVDANFLIYNAITVLILFAISIIMFVKKERYIADLI